MRSIGASPESHFLFEPTKNQMGFRTIFLRSLTLAQRKCSGMTIIVMLGLLSACGILQAPPSRTGAVPGETITVDGTQNIYAVARAHGVSMHDIIVLNNLQAPFTLRPGQRLILPFSPGGAPALGPMPTPVSAAEAPVQQQELPPLTPAEPNKKGTAGLAPVESLNLPSAAPAPVQTTVATVAPQPAPAATVSSPPAVEEAGPPPSDMAWPVKGPVLSGFGPKGQGLNNDGINIGAPKGSPVVASAGGTVVYAGNEMKGFGNLVLIRHGGGWVSAYAHLDRVLVNKDAVVARGDMIGTVGKTGNVPSPQLHFEVRHDGKPVDPQTVMKD